MSDPYKTSDPQTERILSEIEYKKNRYRGSSYASEEKSRKQEEKHLEGIERYIKQSVMIDYCAENPSQDYYDLDFRELTNTTLMEVLATYRAMRDEPRAVLGTKDQLPVFEAARVQFELFKVFGNTLRYDLLHQRLTLKGNAVADSADLRGYVKNREWKGRLPREEEIWEFGRYFSYNPVQDYLNNLIGKAGEDPKGIIDNFSEQVLGVTGDLDKMFIRKTLVGAVARALEPGCKFDTVLVLMGPQGNGKSEFFRNLFGGDNYGTVTETSGDKDWRQAMQCVWCSELGEIDGHLRQKKSSGMKSFITESTDKFRLPYGSEITAHPRPSILVGTTNDPQPLTDPSGNRRYWIVKTSQKIGIQEVEDQRDNVWAAAVQIYQQHSEKYYIDYNDTATMKLVDERNSDYREQHPWEETIKLITECLNSEGRFEATSEQAKELTGNRYGIELRNYFGRYLKTKNILEMLGKEVEKQTTTEGRRVGEAMRNFGFELSARTQEGTKVKVWVPERPRR